jgi:mannose-6-phosphate isomerase-like protein (cupin superfamily)
MQEPANIAVVGNLDIIPYLVLQDLITRGVDPREIGFITFDQHFDASAVVRNGVHEGNWISAAVRDGIGAVAVLGNAGDQAKQLRDGTFTELFSGEEMPIAGEEARLLNIKDPGLIDHLRTLRDYPNVLLDHMMMSNNARNTDPAQMRKAIKNAMAHFQRHDVEHVISFVDLDVLAMVDEPITATNYNVHDPAVRLGMAPLLMPHAFLARRTTSARGKPTYTETHVREAEDEVWRFMEGPMQIQGTLYHPPRAAGPGGMTVGQVVQAIDMTRRFAAENGLQYGVPVGDKRVVLGGVTEVQGKDVQGKSLRAAGEIYNAMINPRN